MAASTRAPAAAERLPAPAASTPGGWRGHPALLALALALACAYAAFASGAIGIAEGSRLQLLVVVVALGAAVSWAGGGGIRWRPGRAAGVGLALLVLLAVWSAVSLLWSTTPDRTWLEVNRVLAYALVVALALALGASDPRAVERMGTLLLAVVSLVALYALVTKVAPGLELPAGDDGPRLGAPLGYANALALLCAMGVPLAVAIASDPGRRRRERAPALAAGLLLVVVLGLTWSRGGVVALITATVVLAALGGARPRSLAVLAALVLLALPVLAVAFELAGTSQPGAPAAARSDDGRTMGLVFLGCLLVLVAVAMAAFRRERREPPAAQRSSAAGRALAAVVAVAVLAGVVALAASDGGLSAKADTFKAPARGDAPGPERLRSASSGNRWAWWNEAAGAWSDRPGVGWGANSFAAMHLRYRDDELPVRHAHSVPLQLLADTGLVGLALFVAAIAALGAAAVARLRTRAGSRDRDLAAAGLAAVAAWVVHGFWDWDWQIPGVTLPALVLLGVLAAAPWVERRQEAGGAPVLAAAAAALVLSAFAASAILPAWADGKASDALAVRSGEPALAEAAAEADLAARLDPLAVRPLFAAAEVERRRGRLLQARGYLLRAVERQPESAEAWRNLARSAFELADRAGFERAALRALELDPRSSRTRRLAERAVAFRAPSGASATAVGTPLTPAPVQAPALPEIVPLPPAGAPGATGTTGATGPTGAGGPTAP